MATMHVELVSVEKALWSGEATAVFARTPEGELGVLPGHAPLLGALAPGFAVRIDRDGDTSVKVAGHGGILNRSARTAWPCSARWPSSATRST